MSLSSQHVRNQLLNHAKTEYTTYSNTDSLPASVEESVRLAAFAMENENRLTEKDVDQAKAAFLRLIEFCKREAAESRPINEHDFRAAIYSETLWPYGGYKSALGSQH